MEEKKDVLLTFKSTKKSKDKADRDRLQLYLSVDELMVFIKTLKEVASERGAVIDIHTGFETSKTGTSYLHSFAFARGIQEPRAAGEFVPKANVVEDKIAALKGI